MPYTLHIHMHMLFEPGGSRQVRAIYIDVHICITCKCTGAGNRCAQAQVYTHVHGVHVEHGVHGVQVTW